MLVSALAAADEVAEKSRPVDPVPAAAAEPVVANQYGKGVLIRFEGEITPRRQQYLYRKLDDARAYGADLLVIEIDSPGGYLAESLDMAHRLRDIRWAHTVAYISRQALSGAAILSLGCDEIVMAPTAVMGDAGAVFLDKNFLFQHAPEKIRSDLARKIRDLAEAKGRPPALAEAMVDMDLVVFRVRNKQTGQETFMSQAEIDADPGAWEKLRPIHESRPGHFLEVNGTQAVDLHLASGLVDSQEQLRRRYALPEPFLVLEPTTVDTVVYILNLPIITGLLIIIGLVALYVEFSAPGIGVGGLVSLLCFALFFWSKFMGGTSGWLEVVLFVMGLVFLGVELFVLPGFGVAGLTGILLVLASLVLASQSFVVPHTNREFAVFTRSILATLVPIALVFGVAWIVSWRTGKVPLLGRLALEPGGRTSQVGASAAAADSDYDAPPVSVGDLGRAETPLRPAGKARFGDALVDVVADRTILDRGTPITVVEVHGNRVVVRQAEEAT